MLDFNPFLTVYEQSALVFIHSQTNYAPQRKSKVVMNITFENLGVLIKSLQGFDKQGLILFPHPNYCRQGHLFKQSDTNIADQFHAGNSEGVSAFIVTHGTWALYDRPNYQGVRKKVGCKDQFEPGTYNANGGFDMVSIWTLTVCELHVLAHKCLNYAINLYYFEGQRSSKVLKKVADMLWEWRTRQVATKIKRLIMSPVLSH